MDAADSQTKPNVEFVPVELEPMHKQRWSSNTVRLVYAMIPPHTKSLWHQHLQYSVYIVVAPLDVTEQSYGVEPHTLLQDKGSVFCRDHTKDRLLHVATTGELPSKIIIIELLTEMKDVMVHDQVAVHDSKCVELLNDEPKCRVYRLTLGESSDASTTRISLELPTAAVLVVVEDCEVEITTSSDALKAKTKKQSLTVGDDVQLSAGEFSMTLLSSSATKTQFVLTEVY